MVFTQFSYVSSYVNMVSIVWLRDSKNCTPSRIYCPLYSPYHFLWSSFTFLPVFQQIFPFSGSCYHPPSELWWLFRPMIPPPIPVHWSTWWWWQRPRRRSNAPSCTLPLHTKNHLSTYCYNAWQCHSGFDFTNLVVPPLRSYT